MSNRLLNERIIAKSRFHHLGLETFYRSGRFPFDRLIRFYDFAEINEAIEDIKKGQTIKAVLKVSTP